VRLVYYSLAHSGGSACEYQWIQSIRSLRRYNPTVPVFLFLYSGASAALLNQADRSRVSVLNLGDYREYLQRMHVRGSVLALYPTFHKFLPLGDGPLDQASQLLYLDCDTFFFADVETLFHTYAGRDWNAREEPLSRRSHYGYKPSHIDESALESIARRERLRLISPFNSGVCLLNHPMKIGFNRIRVSFLDLAWRLLVGRELRTSCSSGSNVNIQEAVLAAAGAVDRRRALPYPSSNSWILEQIALWLALGHLPQISHGLISRQHVVQGGEFQEAFGGGRRCVVAHYYSHLTTQFFFAVPPIPDY
jgi:hypothetical protein